MLEIRNSLRQLVIVPVRRESGALEAVRLRGREVLPNPANPEPITPDAVTAYLESLVKRGYVALVNTAA